jgi:HEAT repeat protein
MYQALAIAILLIGALFMGLVTLIVLNKMWRESQEAYFRMRRRDLEPAVLRYSHGEGRSLMAVMGDVPRARDRRVLLEVLLEHVQRVRGIEHERLSRALDEMGFVKEMTADLRHRHWWRRATAAENLGLSGAQHAVDALTGVLADPSAEVRMRAAKALGALGGSASIRALVGALEEPNRWSTIRIADILSGMGPPVVDELVEVFPRLSKAGRLSTLEILGRVRPLDRREWLEERTRDDDPDLRARACHALGRIGDPSALASVVTALADEAWPVRAMAAKALGWIGSAKAVDPLCIALRDSEWWVRSNAAHSLLAAGTTGTAALERMLDDDDIYARHQAILMLEHSGVVDRNASELALEDPERRQKAFSFIRHLVEAGQIQRLRSLAVEHPEAAVRDLLGSILPQGRPEQA